MEDKMQDLIAKKEELVRKLEEINNSITQEDLENASNEELLVYTKLTLELKKKITAIEMVEKGLK